VVHPATSLTLFAGERGFGGAQPSRTLLSRNVADAPLRHGPYAPSRLEGHPSGLLGVETYGMATLGVELWR